MLYFEIWLLALLSTGSVPPEQEPIITTRVVTSSPPGEPCTESVEVCVPVWRDFFKTRGTGLIALRDEPMSLAVSALGSGFRLLRLNPGRDPGQELEISLPSPSTGGRLILDVSGSFAAESDLNGLRLFRSQGDQGPSVSILHLLRDLRLPVGEELSLLEIADAEAGDWTLCNSSGRCVTEYLPPGGLSTLGEEDAAR